MEEMRALPSPGRPRWLSHEARVELPCGLQLRPIVALVRATHGFDCQLRVHSGHRSADGRSVFSMALLSARPGATLVFEAAGPEAQACLDALAKVAEHELKGGLG